jgi:hypothetical protein
MFFFFYIFGFRSSSFLAALIPAWPGTSRLTGIADVAFG